jgi:hypothetical protein
VSAAVANDDYNINVRATVERAYTRWGKEPPRDHGRVYAIVSMEQIDNDANELVRPVNEYALLKNLKRVLAKRGFVEAAAGVTPELVLTVMYGRGWLINPYLDDDAIGGVDPMGLGVVTIVGIPKDVIRHKEPGFEEKVQRANGEKLIISVAAWQFPDGRKPGEKKEKPKKLWRVTVNTDDADQDLNAQMEKMLAAGAVYFDREIDKEEVTVRSSVPEGQVKVGDATVVEPPPPAK